MPNYYKRNILLPCTDFWGGGFFPEYSLVNFEKKFSNRWENLVTLI